MTSSHSKCVADANIWIDLHRGTLLDVAFRLPFRWFAPDLVINELEKTPSGSELVKRGLQSLELSGHEMEMVAQLSVTHRRLSIPDLSALVLAKNQGIMLLTGDGKLRRLAKQEGIECHGILWILDEIVRLGVLPSQQAAKALQAILDAGSRLPAKQCNRRLAQWTR